jgi:hypothetical protein
MRIEDWIDRLVTMNSSEVAAKDYISRHLNPWSPRRRWNTQRAALNTWFYWGRQWIEAIGELVPTAGAYTFRELYRSGLGTFKRPVTNIVAPAVDNEASRLGRKELIPDVRASKNRPEWVAAANLARDIARFEMEKLLWADKREQINLNLCLEATAIARTFWDEDQHDAVFLAQPDAMQCPGCERLFSSPVVPRSFATLGIPPEEEGGGIREMHHKESLVDFEEEGEASAMHPEGIPRVRMQHCPFCPEPIRLEGYDVSEDEAFEDGDAFKRPLGLKCPRGMANIEVVNVHEYYPGNTGIGIEPIEAKVHHQMVVKPLEQILSRWPELDGRIYPEDPTTLLRLNPMFNEPIFWQMAGAGQSDGYTATIETYDRHARVREVIVEPVPGFPGLEDGAWIVQVCDELLMQPLCVTVKTPEGPKKVPRVKYAFARFKRIPNYFYGRTFVDDILPIQRRLNELDAQWTDLRERGVPTIWTPMNTEMYTKEESEGSLRVVMYDSPNPAWNPQQAIFPGIPLTGNAYAQERQNTFSDAQQVGAAQDIEMGRGTGGPKTTSGLMLLSEEAAQKRGPRERSLAGMFQTLWQHHLDLTWAFRKEKAVVEVGEAGSTVFEKKEYVGEDLMGGVRVRVDTRAGYDITLYNKEATGEALQMGLIDPSKPAVKDKVLDLMQLPKDLAEGEGIQIQRAEMAWSDFVTEKLVPIYDESLFDPVVWFEVLGKRWMEDVNYMRLRSVGFEEIIERLTGWEEAMAQEEQKDAQQKMIYGSHPPEQWPTLYERQSAIDQANYEAQVAAVEAMGGMPPPVPKPTQPPPTDGFLPMNTARRIYTVWKRMLPVLNNAEAATEIAENLDISTKAIENLKEIDRLLQMRAVIEAAKRLASPPAEMGAPPPEEAMAPQGAAGGEGGM